MSKSISAQKKDLSEKLKSLPEARKVSLLEKLNQIITLGMRQLILDNLDPKADKVAVQKIFITGNDDNLFALGCRRIPGFAQKVDNFINLIAKDLELEVNYGR